MSLTKEDIAIQEILDAGRKMFQQFGLNKTTMEDIAKSAGKGKSTLYYYFKSKNDIFDRVIEEEMGDFFESLKSELSKHESIEDKLKTFVAYKFQKTKEKINLYRLTIDTSNAIELSGHFKLLRDKFDQKEIQLVSDMLHDGISNKELAHMDDDEVNLIAELIISSIRGVELDIVTRDRFKTLDSKVELISNIMIKGLK
ncbi:TetR/AcrR family transcriptional regulator [bacterium SCSIO 12741]|nr:TetR/AcrR family transcriptional regulator [bacterium SCSIO 12741]